MRESAESRSAAVRAVLLRFYPHQYAWGESCALTVSLLLGFREAAHDGRVMNPISNPTIVCGLAVGRVECVSNVHLCHVTTVPAGRGLPATHGTWSSQSAKQPSPRCSRNDPLTLLIALGILPQTADQSPGQPNCAPPSSASAPGAPAATCAMHLRDMHDQNRHD